MNKKLIASAVSAMVLALPSMMLAFNPGGIPNAVPGLSINTLVDVVFSIIWPVVVAFVIIVFIISAFIFLTAQGDPAKVAQGRLAVIWGVVGVVVALLAWSIPFIVRNTLGQGI